MQNQVCESRVLSASLACPLCLSSCIDVTNPEDTNLENCNETNAHQDPSTALAIGEEILPRQDDAKEEQSAGSMVS